MNRLGIVLVAVVLALAPRQGWAQKEASHWGVSGSFVPAWEVPRFVGELVGQEIDITGSELTVGVVRGRTLGGDWGVSYVRQKVDPGSTVSSGMSEYCSSSGGASTCMRLGSVYRATDAYLQGVEVHKFIPFGTIKRRVQIGVNLAGGIGQLEGRAERTRYDVDYRFDAARREYVLAPSQSVESVPAHDLLDIPKLPLAKVELAVAGIVARGLKIRASGGFALPGSHRFSITGVYLIGAR